MPKLLKISTAYINRHISRFEKAVRAHEMMGAKHPDDHDLIQQQYDNAKDTLARFMRESIIEEPKHGPKCGCHYCD